MKFFLDTSNKKLVMAIIDTENKIVNFSIEDSKNDMVKKTVSSIEKFISENKFKIENIKEYMITIGPGSFTGVKVALNIIKSINLVNEIEKIHIISTFKLLRNDNMKYTAIKFGKSKFYLKNNSFPRITVKTEEEINKLDNVTIDYKNFDKNVLQDKIDKKEFKTIKNIEKIKIKYLVKF